MVIVSHVNTAGVHVWSNVHSTRVVGSFYQDALTLQRGLLRKKSELVGKFAFTVFLCLPGLSLSFEVTD